MPLSDNNDLDDAIITIDASNLDQFYTTKPPNPSEWRGGQTLHKAAFGCSRGPPQQAAVKQEGPNKRESKKVGCRFLLEARILRSDPDTVVVVEKNGHFHHTPGDAEDARWLSFGNETKERIIDVSFNIFYRLYVALLCI